MRVESSVTSVTWIPSEAIAGMTKVPFEVGVTEYDAPPPDVIDDIDGLLASGAIRFANVLSAWAEIVDGRVVDAGYSGGGRIGISKINIGVRQLAYPAIPFPDIQVDPEMSDTSVRFVQTAGGRTNMPAPRRVRHKPFVQFRAPTAWTTLGLTIRGDGSAHHEVIGASSFPRHWIYDTEGKLVAKSGVIDFDKWYREAFGEHTPWGDQDSPAVVTEVETALERDLSLAIMRKGENPRIHKVPDGEALVQQGQPGGDLFLLLDGVLVVEVDGEPIVEVGPGAILGERALLEEGKRTSTLRAATNCKVAVASPAQVDKEALQELALGHRREERS